MKDKLRTPDAIRISIIDQPGNSTEAEACEDASELVGGKSG